MLAVPDAGPAPFKVGRGVSIGANDEHVRTGIGRDTRHNARSVITPQPGAWVAYGQ